MTDNKKESLSALIDGEASEIEVHRLVREFRSSDSLASSWAVFQQIRTTVRAESQPVSVEIHQRLFQRISDSVAQEEVHQHSQPVRAPRRNVVIGSLALAASMVVAVFIGVQQQAPDALPVASTTNQSPVYDVQTVANQSNIPVSQAPELVELDEEKQRRLRAYLNQHDRMARMNPDSQLVNYKETPKK